MLRNTLNTFITATFIMLLGVSSSAKAVVLPSGNLMGITTVTFGGGDPEPPSKTKVIVNLVPSAPSVSIVRDAVEALEPGTAVELTVTITSTANGLDNYVVTAAAVGSGGLEGIGELVFIEPKGLAGDSIALGATAAISIDGREITVLYDGEADNGNVNGIEADDTVIIGDNEYEVLSISDTEESSTITITLEDGQQLPTIELGTHIVERKTETVTIQSIATLKKGADWEDLQVTYSVSAQSEQADPGTDDLAVIVLEEERLPTYDKWVRNVIPERNPDEDGVADNLLAGQWGVTDEGILGKDWHQAGVTALPDDILEYLVVVRAGNREDVNEWALNESPPDFTEMVDESGRVYSATIQGYDWVSWSYRPGERSFSATFEDWDSLARNDSFYLTYQVKVIGGVGDDSAVSTAEHGTPWRESFTMLAVDTACWCDGPRSPVDYCTVEGWAAGVNGFALEDDNQSTIRRMVDDGAGLKAVATRLAGWVVSSLGVGWVKMLYCR